MKSIGKYVLIFACVVAVTSHAAKKEKKKVSLEYPTLLTEKRLPKQYNSFMLESNNDEILLLLGYLINDILIGNTQRIQQAIDVIKKKNPGDKAEILDRALAFAVLCDLGEVESKFIDMNTIKKNGKLAIDPLKKAGASSNRPHKILDGKTLNSFLEAEQIKVKQLKAKQEKI